MHRFVLLFFLYLLNFSSLLFALPSILESINQIRQKEGVPLLLEDPLLSRTASLYSQQLYQQGRLTHHDRYGSRGLERYRNQGGTTATVAEILGAGSIQQEVITAWLASPSHREVLLHRDWTDYGAGTFAGEETTVFVVLFTLKKIRELRWNVSSVRLQLNGRCIAPEEGPPHIQLIRGKILPQSWDSASGTFTFDLPRENIPLCIRLGYLKPGGGFHLCNVIYPSLDENKPEMP